MINWWAITGERGGMEVFRRKSKGVAGRGSGDWVLDFRHDCIYTSKTVAEKKAQELRSREGRHRYDDVTDIKVITVTVSF